MITQRDFENGGPSRESAKLIISKELNGNVDDALISNEEQQVEIPETLHQLSQNELDEVFGVNEMLNDFNQDNEEYNNYVESENVHQNENVDNDLASTSK